MNDYGQQLIPNMIPISSMQMSQGSEIPKVKRTRASKSCDLCRKKKIRCDSEISMPCSNCRSAQKECRITSEPRKRGPVSQRYVHELEARLSKMEALLEKYSCPSSASSASSSASPEQQGQNISHPGHEVVQTLDSGISQQFDALTLADYDRAKYIGTSSGIHLLDDDVFRLKRRLKLENNGIVQKVNDDEDEHVIITSEGVSHPIPSPEYRRLDLFKDHPQMTLELADCLIELYFQYCHPYVAILNKIAFLEQYYFANPHPPDRSLLYAICSIGLRIVPTEGVQLGSGDFVGPEIIKALRHSLRQEGYRAIEKAYTRSSISTLQCLILNSMHMEVCEEEDEFTFTWFVTGAALRMAVDLGLHRNSLRWSLPKYEIEVRRRIWHCLNMIDKWVSADLGRPPTIADEDFDVELPSVTELESPYNTLDRPDIPWILKQAREDLARQRPLYQTFHAFATAAPILNRILRGFYSPKKQSSGILNLSLAAALEVELEQWKNSLPSSPQDSNDLGVPFSLMVDIEYNCMLLLLHRPFIQHKDSSTPIDNNVALRALSISTRAASNMLDCMERFTSVLPGSIYSSLCAYSSLQAAIIFLFHAKSDNITTRQQGVHNLIRFVNIFKRKEVVRIHRLVKILESLAAKYAVPVSSTATTEPGFQRQISEEQEEQPIISVCAPATTNVPTTTGCGSVSSPSCMQTQAPAPAPGPVTPSCFDCTNLSSDIPLWSLPNGLTWSDWEMFLQANIYQSQ